jgi:hypothetical protein
MVPGVWLSASLTPGNVDGDGEVWSVLQCCWFACSSILQNHIGLSDSHLQIVCEPHGARLVAKCVPGTVELEKVLKMGLHIWLRVCQVS